MRTAQCAVGPPFHRRPRTAKMAAPHAGRPAAAFGAAHYGEPPSRRIFAEVARGGADWANCCFEMRHLEEVRRFPEIPETMVVLVQTEVAERLAAGPGSKTRGLAGAWLQSDYDVCLVRTVKAVCFWPQPNVGSTIVRCVRHHRNDAVPAEVRDMFRNITKRAFEHRRKQLGTVFKGMIESTARAEDLSNDDWLGLATAFHANLR